MIYDFDTENEMYARASLLLYAIYTSRENNSSLNGLETWKRFNSFAQGSCEESENIPEFIQTFCRKTGTNSIVFGRLDDGKETPVSIGNFGEYAHVAGMCSVDMKMFDSDELLKTIRKCSQFLVLLVRDRIERGKVQKCFSPETGFATRKFGE